ncbi:uncharacterized protein TNCT_525221 [Trichonephila clavata]|uniref:Uncharacterized protein n=1 Tax=Trichonephila clavata TaxID=2740835 RepID=A0A8X6IP43_TRICU|nr:uncharacterized protein TNCT_525221 [Trichonephila clavata]
MRNLAGKGSKAYLEDVEEIVQETAASLSNDELKELADQEDKNIENSYSEEKQKELSTEFLETSLATITEIMNQFIENDPNFDRSSKAKRGVMDALSTYQQLLKERKRETQITLDTFLIKRQKIGKTEETE